MCLDPDDGNPNLRVSIAEDPLERIAEAALMVAGALMETGSRAEVIHEDCVLVARGLGAEQVHLRSGYASLDITVVRGREAVTRMVEVGPHGVNHQLNHAARKLARRIGRGDLTATEAMAEMTRLPRKTPVHAPWVVALAVGCACAAFGRLLGIDLAAFLPVAAGGAVGQAVRRCLGGRGRNVFVTAACVAWLSASIGGLGARWLGSGTSGLAMIASVLLLVPGVPVVNAQADIMEGYPTLGAARAVFVSMLLAFIATGVLLARAMVRP